ncbi:hypothetical protein APR09_005116, partial [Nocardia amikacinitolerans]|nr:hypothetical protein [Nocardia amikacinitolerans]
MEQPLQGAEAGFRVELAGQGANTGAGMIREGGAGEWLVQAAERPATGRRQRG